MRAGISELGYAYRRCTLDRQPRWSTPGSLVRTERAVIDKFEERLKGRLSPLGGTHVLNEVERAPKRQMRQAQVQECTQLTQYTLCRLVEPAGAGWAAPCQKDGRNNVLLITANGPANHGQRTGAARQQWPIYAATIDDHFGSRRTRAEAEQLASPLAKLDGVRLRAGRRAPGPGWPLV